ncbi:hypothetical protein MUK42_21747 [Musa troglodytarum]|uniref:Uncharacterized protein n=1 Tax=Musa troglodytarum TaxID=320322 RepID=A0A9E7G8B2_9LILI|nr:hypothetical protein MUK42_21747 [Musa troglodytarum]
MATSSIAFVRRLRTLRPPSSTTLSAAFVRHCNFIGSQLQFRSPPFGSPTFVLIILLPTEIFSKNFLDFALITVEENLEYSVTITCELTPVATCTIATQAVTSWMKGVNNIHEITASNLQASQIRFGTCGI